jgi:hypothetical protein
VRRSFKNAAFAILILMGILLGRMIFSPYTAWYFIVPNAQFTVDGKAEEGWLHRGKQSETLFLTRRAKGKTESYIISLPQNRQGFVWNCGNWTAPRFPFFPIGDVNPPCWTFYVGEGPAPKSTLPARKLAAGSRFVEFTADDGSRIRGFW